MRVELATEPGTPGWPNEDFAAAAPGAAVLLDGCTTTPRGAGTGCLHGVAWYARALGGILLGQLSADPAIPLPEALANAIEQVRASHADRCDLASPLTPAATVLAVRAAPDGFEVLALADSVIVADYGKDRAPLVITDRHRAASTNPGAAGQARTDTLPRGGGRALPRRWPAPPPRCSATAPPGSPSSTACSAGRNWPLCCVRTARPSCWPGSARPRTPIRTAPAGPGPSCATTPPCCTGRSPADRPSPGYGEAANSRMRCF
jgi:hypothetical protein